MILSLGSAQARADLVAGPPVQLTDFEDAESKAQIAADGDRLVVLRAQERRVGWTLSLDGGRTWKHGGRLVGTKVTGDFWGDHSLSTDGMGRFYAAVRWQGNTLPGRGYTIGIVRGAFHDTTFSWEPGVNFAIPLLSFSYGEGPDFLQLLCDPAAGYLYLAYTECNRAESATGPTNEGIVKFLRSADQGVTWSAPMGLSGIYCNGSRAELGPDGEIYLVWQDLATHQIIGRKSVDQGASFEAPFVVGSVIENPHPPVGWGGGKHPLTGRPREGDFGPNHLTLAVDRSQGPDRGKLYVAWTEIAEGEPVPVASAIQEVEPNGFASQAMPVLLNQGFSGSMEGVHGVSGDCDWFYFEGTGGMTILLRGRSCGVGPAGPFHSGVLMGCAGQDTVALYPGGVDSPCAEPDPEPTFIYTLPHTGRYYLSMGCEDSYLSYQTVVLEFLIAPGSVARDHRDIVMASSADGGLTWAPKRRAPVSPPGYEEAMPALAVDSVGRVHLLWYDRRDPPHECAATVRTYWSYSVDGGVTFAPSVPLSRDEANLADIWALNVGQPPWYVGDYTTLTAIGDKVYAFWPQSEPGRQEADLYGAVIQEDDLTSTQVLGFRAEPAAGRVRLWWSVRSPSLVMGYRLHRAEGDNEAFGPLNGALIATTAAEDYEFEDATAIGGQRYRYRLEVVTANGSQWHGPIEVLIPEPPRLAWESSRPNPFSEAIELRLQVAEAARGMVSVYDVTGHEVRRLHRGPLGPGPVVLAWDGRDRRGRNSPPGVYLVRATVGTETRVRRIVRVE